MPSDKTCEMCRFVEGLELTPDFGTPRVFCRRYAPARGGWVTVKPSDWCGEWEPVEQPDEWADADLKAREREQEQLRAYTDQSRRVETATKAIERQFWGNVQSVRCIDCGFILPYHHVNCRFSFTPQRPGPGS